MRLLSAVLTIAVAGGGCAQTQLAAHVYKSGLPWWNDSDPPPAASPTHDGGTYKVGEPYRINGRVYVPRVDPLYDEIGIASWYGPGFHGKPTANGQPYDMNALTAAHRTLPMPSKVRVTHLAKGLSAVLTVNDRGPFVKGRIIDVSRRAAQVLGFEREGTARVRVELVSDTAEIGAQGPRDSAWFVQGGAFQARANAAKTWRRLAAFGDAAIEPVTVDGRNYYRVRLGPLRQRLDAEILLTRLRQAGHDRAVVVPE